MTRPGLGSELREKGGGGEGGRDGWGGAREGQWQHGGRRGQNGWGGARQGYRRKECLEDWIGHGGAQ